MDQQPFFFPPVLDATSLANFRALLAQYGGGSGAVDSVNSKTGVVVLTTSDIADATDKRYVTDAERTVLGNTSGTNTGDQTDATLSTSDITTNNVSTSKHGFAPKVTDTGKFLKGDGTWSSPSVGSTVFTSGIFQWITSNTGTQTITHGLGKSPLFIRITMISNAVGTTGPNIGSTGTWSSTTGTATLWYGFSSGGASTFNNDNSSIILSMQSAGTTQSIAAVSSVDATNITLTWSKIGSPNVTALAFWEAWA